MNNYSTTYDIYRNMINICLTKFTNDPWSKIMMEGFSLALKDNKDFNVEQIFEYPKKKYDLIILIGIRSIIKRNLDKDKILPFCSKLIDMGDSALDKRRNHEDAYIYFIPSDTKLYDHYHYLPKFILEDYLYPSEEKSKNLNVYVDHFKYQTKKERQISINTINKIFTDIKNSEIPLNIFYHTSNGIETNRMTPEIPDENTSQCAKFISFEEISKIYRKTDIFFPTHRETQGMLAQEIGACGGITILQDWMYPRNTHHQFPLIYYKENQKIDFLFIKKILDKRSKNEFRNIVLKYCGFENFKIELQKLIRLLFNRL